MRKVYDFIHDRVVQEIPNTEERRSVSIAWAIVSKAAEMSKGHCRRPIAMTSLLYSEMKTVSIYRAMFGVGRLILV